MPKGEFDGTEDQRRLARPDDAHRRRHRHRSRGVHVGEQLVLAGVARPLSDPHRRRRLVPGLRSPRPHHRYHGESQRLTGHSDVTAAISTLQGRSLLRVVINLWRISMPKFTKIAVAGAAGVDSSTSVKTGVGIGTK